MAKTKDDKIVEMAKNGEELTTIAAENGVCVPTVRNVMRRNNVSLVKRQSPRNNLLQIVAGLVKKESGVEIANRMNVSRQYVNQVKNLCKELGIPV